MGIVAAVASFLAQQDCNILESTQFDDELSGHFYMRMMFGAGALNIEVVAVVLSTETALPCA